MAFKKKSGTAKAVPVIPLPTVLLVLCKNLTHLNRKNKHLGFYSRKYSIKMARTSLIKQSEIHNIMTNMIKKQN